VVINWTTTPPAAYQIMVVGFIGADFYVGNKTVSNTQDNTVNNTDPGFEPLWGFGACVNRLSGNDSYTYNAWSMGLFHNGSSLSQKCFSFFSPNGESAPVDVSGQAVTDGAGAAPFTSGALRFRLELGSFDSEGFSITTREGTPEQDTDFFYICGRDAVNLKLSTLTTATSSGSDSITDPGFEPIGVLGLASNFTALDTAKITGDSVCGMFAFTDTDEYCISGYKEDDALSASHTWSFMAAAALDILIENEGLEDLYTAAFTQWTSTGWDWNYSVPSGSPHYLFTLAFEPIGSPWYVYAQQ